MLVSVAPQQADRSSTLEEVDSNPPSAKLVTVLVSVLAGVAEAASMAPGQYETWCAACWQNAQSLVVAKCQQSSGTCCL